MDTDLGSRRRFLRDLGIGGAATVGAVALAGTLAPAVAGAQGSGSPGLVDLPPGDLGTLAALESVELAAADALRLAVERRVLGPVATEHCRTFEHHHREHAAALVEASGRRPDEVGEADPAVLAEVAAQIGGAGSDAALTEVLAAFEERVAATAQAALAALATGAAATPVGRIVATDAQQATVLGQLTGAPLAELLPVTQTTAGAFPLPATAA